MVLRQKTTHIDRVLLILHRWRNELEVIWLHSHVRKRPIHAYCPSSALTVEVAYGALLSVK